MEGMLTLRTIPCRKPFATTARWSWPIFSSPCFRNSEYEEYSYPDFSDVSNTATRRQGGHILSWRQQLSWNVSSLVVSSTSTWLGCSTGLLIISPCTNPERKGCTLWFRKYFEPTRVSFLEVMRGPKQRCLLLFQQMTSRRIAKSC